MKARAALKILFRIKSVFPKERNVAEPIIDELSKIMGMSGTISKDIYTLAQRYHQQLNELFPKKVVKPVAEKEEPKKEETKKRDQSPPRKREEKAR